MTNFYAGYNFKFAGLGSRFSFNVYNVFDVTYWSEARDGYDVDDNGDIYRDETTIEGFYGFGRTFSFGWKIFF